MVRMFKDYPKLIGVATVATLMVALLGAACSQGDRGAFSEPAAPSPVEGQPEANNGGQGVVLTVRVLDAGTVALRSPTFR